MREEGHRQGEKGRKEHRRRRSSLNESGVLNLTERLEEEEESSFVRPEGIGLKRGCTGTPAPGLRAPVALD